MSKCIRNSKAIGYLVNVWFDIQNTCVFLVIALIVISVSSDMPKIDGI